jgi:mono/diheme cytochrome c family protein
MKRLKLAFFAILCSGIALVAGSKKGDLVSQVSARRAARPNPLASDPRARQAGAKLYAEHCAECHGQSREGNGKAPPLAHSGIYNAPPGALFWTIRSGSVFDGMPPFAELPEQQRWQIVTFLKEDHTGSAAPSR